MQEESLVKLIEERFDKMGSELPVFHPIALKLQQLLSKDDYSTPEIGKLIEKDPAITASVLKMANNALYATLQPAKTVQDAIVRLGSKSIYNLVMTTTQRALYQSQSQGLDHWTKPLWNHALGVAIASRWLATQLGFQRHAEECFLAGLLHDIGKLIVLRIVTYLKKLGWEEDHISTSVISEIIEDLHPALGEKFTLHHNIPQVYCQVVAQHHDAEVTGENIILNLVRLANLVCHRVGIGLKHDPELMLSTTPEADSLKTSDLLLAKLQVKLDDYLASVHDILGQD